MMPPFQVAISMIGRTLSHYQIREKIGSGGMGDVYLAHDTELNRDVALKVLPPELAENEERRARFKREAQAVAALNHPNIVTVYSVEEAEGVHFITMELVRGKTIWELIPGKGLPLAKFFEIAIPLSDAVAAAHEAGIVHRDLKPANVMVTDDGRVKVLDFGLAHHEAPIQVEGDSESPTALRTQVGALAGTLHYMSPEQIEGKSVDHRSDIFSLGVICYQMLTGKRPFVGGSPASVMAAILQQPAPELEQRPREVTLLVKLCLHKDPSARYQSVLDVRNQLRLMRDEGVTGDASVAGTGKTSPAWGFLASALIGATVAGVAVVTWTHSNGTRVGDNTHRISLANPVQLTSAIGSEQFPTWAPDGKRIAYASNQTGDWDIWVTQLPGGEPVDLTRDPEVNEHAPSWSPDGSMIAFYSDRDGGGYDVMSSLGGSPRRILPATPVAQNLAAPSPQWSSDGSKLAGVVHEGKEAFLNIVDIRTLEPRRLPLPGRSAFRLNLSWSPDDKFFAYVDAVNWTADTTAIWLMDASTGEASMLTDDSRNYWSPSWSAESHTLYFVSNRGGTMELWSQAIGENGRPESEARQLSVGVGMRDAAISPDGSRLAYSRGEGVTNIWRVPIPGHNVATWADAEQLTFDQAFVQSLSVSRDGKRIYFNSDRAGNQDIWMLEPDTGSLRQLTLDPSPDWYPEVSPDGRQLAFYSYRSGNRDVWIMPSTGGAAKQMTTHEAADVIPSWSPDGSELTYLSLRSGSYDVWILPLDGGAPRQVTSDPAMQAFPYWSPDGQFLYFSSNRGDGVPRLWRQRLPDGVPEQITDGPGYRSRLSNTGKVIYFTTGPGDRAGNIWAVSLEDGSEYPVTDLTGRRGTIYSDGFAVSDEYLYFAWEEDLADIWVMDVVQ